MPRIYYIDTHTPPAVFLPLMRRTLLGTLLLLLLLLSIPCAAAAAAAACECPAGSVCQIANTSAPCPRLGRCSGPHADVACSAATCGDGGDGEGCPPVPDTLSMFNASYSGRRFANHTAVVVGGTSGMGFAAAAMLVQECAREVLIGSRNAQQGQLAQLVLEDIARSTQPHCSGTAATAVTYVQMDATDRASIRNLLGASKFAIDVVIHTAAIPGWTGDFTELSDDAFLTAHDAVYNNLYGGTFVALEAMGYWKRRHVRSPSLVITSSENGMDPCPGCAQYGMSKHGLIGLATSLANTSNVRVSVVLPGLVDTPFTWNQARGNIVQNGTLVPAPGLSGPIQIWQCVQNGKLVRDGDCPDGGTGYNCPCPDVARDDPRVPLLVDMLMANTSLVHPNSVAREILALASGSVAPGVVVVPNAPPNGKGAAPPSTRTCPDNMWMQCPVTLAQ